MFRKPKKGKKAGRNKRKARDDSDDEDGGIQGEESTSELIAEAKRSNSKIPKTAKTSTNFSAGSAADNRAVMHQYETVKSRISEKELATRTAEHHPEEEKSGGDNDATRGNDGIFRDRTRNKFHAGPIKSSAFVRTTCRFDYQPDICKDYKETGFCGFGDTCIYLHDRGDSLTGWQLEQQWEEQRKKEQAQKELDAFADGKDAEKDNVTVVPDDGLPFACFLCRDFFKQPVVTSCGHYFCEKCIMDHVRKESKSLCPICKKDTNGVFNEPKKLLLKKRKVAGRSATWQEFADACKKPSNNSDDDE